MFSVVNTFFTDMDKFLIFLGRMVKGGWNLEKGTWSYTEGSY
jgi:hypothetical protein